MISLTTDFGLADPYVGQMKAVLLSIAPDLRIVDLTHEVAPQAVSEAAFILETSWSFFPEGSVHVVVVDPGVGTSRRRLAVESQGHTFIGPNNGCLSAAFPGQLRGMRGPDEGYDVRGMKIPESIEAVSVTELGLLPKPPSATFEGRDVFAPIAALLAKGAPLHGFGPAVSEALAFPAFAAPEVDGVIDGIVMRADRFGNLITDIRAESVRPNAVVEVAGEALRLVRTYSDAAGLAAVVGSSGYIEIALPKGSAAAALAAGPGTAVQVTA